MSDKMSALYKKFLHSQLRSVDGANATEEMLHSQLTSCRRRSLAMLDIHSEQESSMRVAYPPKRHALQMVRRPDPGGRERPTANTQSPHVHADPPRQPGDDTDAERVPQTDGVGDEKEPWHRRRGSWRLSPHIVDPTPPPRAAALEVKTARWPGGTAAHPLHPGVLAVEECGASHPKRHSRGLRIPQVNGHTHIHSTIQLIANSGHES